MRKWDKESAQNQKANLDRNLLLSRPAFGSSGSHINISRGSSRPSKQSTESSSTLNGPPQTSGISSKNPNRSPAGTATSEGRQPQARQKALFESATNNPIDTSSTTLTNNNLISILKQQNLEHYANEFINRGFTNDTKKLAGLSPSSRDQLLSDINCSSGQKQSMLEMIARIELEGIEADKEVVPSTALKKKQTIVKGSQQQMSSSLSRVSPGVTSSTSTTAVNNKLINIRNRNAAAAPPAAMIIKSNNQQIGSKQGQLLPPTTSQIRGTIASKATSSTETFARRTVQPIPSLSSEGRNNAHMFYQGNVRQPKSQSSYQKKRVALPVSQQKEKEARLGYDYFMGESSSNNNNCETAAKDTASPTTIHSAIGYSVEGCDSGVRTNQVEKFSEAVNDLVKEYTFADPATKEKAFFDRPVNPNKRIIVRQPHTDYSNLPSKSLRDHPVDGESAAGNSINSALKQSSLKESSLKTGLSTTSGKHISSMPPRDPAKQSLSTLTSTLKKQSFPKIPPVLATQRNNTTLNSNINNTEANNSTAVTSTTSIQQVGMKTTVSVGLQGTVRSSSIGNQKQSGVVLPALKQNAQVKSDQNVIKFNHQKFVNPAVSNSTTSGAEKVKQSSQQQGVQPTGVKTGDRLRKNNNQAPSFEQLSKRITGGDQLQGNSTTGKGLSRILKAEKTVEDDMCLVPEFDANDQIVTTYKKNRLLINLSMKNGQKEKDVDDLDPQLDYESMKLMYLSFDGGKLTSTIVNLDIEEMCYCLACAVLKHIDRGIESIMQRSLLMPSQSRDLQAIEEEEKEGKLMQSQEQLRGQVKSKKKEERIPIKAPQLVAEIPLGVVDNSHQNNNAISTTDATSLCQTDTPVQEPVTSISSEAACKVDEDVKVVKVGGDQEFDASDSAEEEEDDDDDENEEDLKSKLSRYRNNFQWKDPRCLSEISERTHEVSHQQINSSMEPINGLMQKTQLRGGDTASNKDSVSILKSRPGRSAHGRQQQLQSITQGLNQNQNSNSNYGGGAVDGIEDKVVVKVGNEEFLREMCGEVESEGEIDDDLENNDANVLALKDAVAGAVAAVANVEQIQQSQQLLSFSRISRYSMVMPNDEASNKRLFDKTYNYSDDSDAIFAAKPTRENVQSYCKNVCIQCQLEKQIPIIALVYVERLLVKSGFAVTARNWRKIILTAMIMASKIWDDESFENQNFAQAFPQFNVIQINEMERVFLNFIDYNLYVNAADYARYYFILREFAQKNKKSFPLRPLDLKTILFLQNNANRAQSNLREYYSNPLNKSF